MLENKKVLVVDDDIRNTYSIKQILQGRGLELNLAMNGQEALNKIKEKGDYDLILMDIMMPEMDGYETITEIRKTYSKEELPIIAVTAKAMKGDKEKCIQVGANDYISKPIDSDVLLSLMRVWMGGLATLIK